MNKTIGLSIIGSTSMAGQLAAQDRTVLPIKEPVRPTYTELDVRDATAPQRFEVKAPENAPNVVLILIDDMGFGVSEAFGGPIATPTMNNLAEMG